MSAIAGVLLFDETLDSPVLTRQVMGRMTVRGPDRQAQWSSGPVALGHCLLRTTPEAVAENQPLVDLERGLVLVWDGRLDNREQLYKSLRPPFSRKETPDCAFVLEAYARWGTSCPARLEGDFAFAVWDAQRQQLFCARDLMGGAPFTYAVTDRLFAFASDWDALPGLPGVTPRPNEDRIAGLLLSDTLARADRRTWQQDVLHLWGGESMLVDRTGKVHIERYAALEPAPARYSSVEECGEQFQQVFGEAVRRRMRASNDVALMMSGGLDTAALLATARRLGPEMRQRRLECYSAIDDDLASGVESVAIEALSRLPGVNAHRVCVPSFTGMVSATDLLDVTWSRAHPVDNSILIPALMYLAASRDGRRVMLHGASGDIVQSTPPGYVSICLRRGQLRRAWRESRAASRNHLILRGRSPLSIFVENAGRAFAPPMMKKLLRSWRGRPPIEGRSLVNAEFAARIRLFERIEERLLEQQMASPMEAFALRLQNVHHSIMATMAISARVAGRFGMEARDPWADRQVVDFFLGLPAEFLVRDGWTKYLVRTCFQDELPAEVLWRSDKGHLGPRVTQRLMVESPELVGRLFEKDLGWLKPYVNLQEARRTFANFSAQTNPASGDSVLQLATLIMWLKNLNSDML